MDLQLTGDLPKPKYNNSAGRLAALLSLADGPRARTLAQIAASLYGVEVSGSTDESRAVLALTIDLTRLYDQLIQDIDSLPDEATRQEAKEGLADLPKSIFVPNAAAQMRQLPASEKSLLLMVGSMIQKDDDVEDSDADAIRKAVEDLRTEIENSDVSKTAKQAMLEVCRLARNSLDQYSIYGARGFKVAFKKLLAELMEVYLDDKEAPDTEWFKKALAVAKALDDAAARLGKYKPLLEYGMTLFIGGPPNA